MLDLLYTVVHDIWTTMVPPRQTRRYTKCKKKFELKHVETEIFKNGPPHHTRRFQELKVKEPTKASSKPREHLSKSSSKNLDNCGTSSFDEEVPHMHEMNII